VNPSVTLIASVLQWRPATGFSESRRLAAD
jgi:hypothetical protein